MTSFTTSMLVRQCASLGEEAFLRQYDHDWILWEPGAWTPPIKASATLPAPDEVLHHPNTTGVALAFALSSAAGASEVTLGRSKGCDLVINDGTLSSVHLIFSRGPEGWAVRDAGSKNGASVDGARLLAHQDVPISNGSRLVCAQVLLSYYTAAGLLDRLIKPLPGYR